MSWGDFYVVDVEELYETFLEKTVSDDISEGAFQKWILSQLENGNLAETELGDYIWL